MKDVIIKQDEAIKAQSTYIKFLELKLMYTDPKPHYFEEQDSSPINDGPI